MYAYYAYRAALCALIACGYSRSLRTSIWLLVYRIISVVAEGEIVRHPRRPMSWTKRGTGSCANCSQEYSCRWKPVNCTKCGVHIGGTRSEISGKKSRPNHPAAVLVYKTTNENVFSVQTSTRDDRCFVVQEGNTFLCCHAQCKTSRATFVSSNLTNNFSCSHTKKCKDAVAPDCVLELSNERIEQYQADSSTKEMLLSLHQSCVPGCPIVCSVSESSYAVLGFPSTNNTIGYAHVKKNKGGLVCSSKDSECNGFVAKGKYERAKKLCTPIMYVTNNVFLKY